MKNVYLCSFASPDLKKTEKRFLKEAMSMNLYKKIKIYHYKDLNETTKKKIKYIKKSEKRGFGCWIWKPFIVNDFLKKIEYGSILHYLDIGFSYNINGKKRLLQYFNICNKKNILIFQYKKTKKKIFKKYKQKVFYEHQYTKRDLWDNKFQIKENSKIMNSGQILSGTFMIKKNYFTIEIIKKWLNISKKINLINNKPSAKIELKSFIEHRHDQSIFSLLCKKNKIKSLSSTEVEGLNIRNKTNWNYHKNYPLLAKRDKKRDFFGFLIKIIDKFGFYTS